jgi:hypothetical protein
VYLTRIVSAGDESWSDIRCVATDGAAAFPHVLETALPNVPQLRCLFHIYQNLRTNLFSKLGDKWQAFMDAFRKCSYEVSTEEEFTSHWTDIIKKFPAAASYLNSQLFKCRTTWSSAWTLQFTTFGARSTQRVESMNALVKHFTDTNDPLSGLFDAIVHISDEQVNRLKARLLSDPLTNNQCNGPVYRQAALVVTKEAAELLHSEATFESDYVATWYSVRPNHQSESPGAK